MPAPIVDLSGFGSGQNIERLVRQLVQVESQKSQKWARQNKETEAKIQALKKLKDLTTKLESQSKKFTSFSTSFGSKKIVSKPEGFITGTVTNKAALSENRINILQIATFHQIVSNQINENKKISPGTFHIISGENELKLDFAGGNIRNFYEFLNEQKEKFYSVSLIKVDRKNYVISIKSNFSGKTNKIVFIDEENILKEIGFLDKNKNLKSDISNEPKEVQEKIQFNLKNLRLFQSFRFKNSQKKDFSPYYEKEKLIIKDNTAFLFPFPKKDYKKFKLIFELDIQDLLFQKESTFEIGYIYYSGNKNEKIKRQKQSLQNLFEIDIQLEDDQSLKEIFICNPFKKDLIFNFIKLKTTDFPIVSVEEDGSNTIQNAQDSILEIDGIKITRDKKEQISDIFEGVSLNLLKLTDNEEINLSIDKDIDKEVQMIDSFVKSHNNLLSYIYKLTKSEKSDGIEERSTENQSIDSNYWRVKSKSGLLSGDATILQLLNGVNRVTNRIYPGEIKILSQIGVNTGKVGTSNQTALLSIDKSILEEKLLTAPLEVKDFFSFDTNFDNKIDDGLAHRMILLLRPYNNFSGGLIENKIRMLKESLKNNNKKIKDFEIYLSKYEDKLRTKFMYMEKGVGKNKRLGQYLKNQLSGLQKQE